MADISDIEQALVDAISAALFTGSYTDYTVATTTLGVIGLPIRNYRGWPIDNQLVQDLKNGITNISVFNHGMAKNVTKYLRNSTIVETQRVDPTMFATLSGSTVTFSGTANTGQTIGIGIRLPNGYGFSYRMLSSDTPTTVATMFANNLAGASSSGPVLTIDAQHSDIVIQLGGDVTTWMEVHRNEQIFTVTVWAPTVAIRDQLCSYLDPQLIFINHLMLPDNSVSEPVIGAGTLVDDCIGKEFMWRRTLYYKICYPTSYVTTTPVMVLGYNVLVGDITLVD